MFDCERFSRETIIIFALLSCCRAAPTPTRQTAWETPTARPWGGQRPESCPVRVQKGRTEAAAAAAA